MSSNRFFYMSSSSVFRSQFKRLEPLNVQSVEKHETADAGLFVDFERCSGKNDSLQIDSIWNESSSIIWTQHDRLTRIRTQNRARGSELEIARAFFCKCKNSLRGKHDLKKFNILVHHDINLQEHNKTWRFASYQSAGIFPFYACRHLCVAKKLAELWTSWIRR